MEGQAHILKLISKLFLDDQIRAKGLLVADFLLKEHSQLEYIVFDSFRSIQGLEAIPEDELLFITQVFCNMNPSLLESMYQLNMEDGSDPISLQKEDVRNALSSGVLINPETGLEVENFEDFVYMYFTLGKFFTQNDDL